MTYSMGVCELAPEVARCKRRLECFSACDNQADTFVKWLCHLPWKEWNLDVLTFVQKEDITLVPGGTEEDPCWAVNTAAHFQQLLATPDIVSNLIQHYIGRYLETLENNLGSATVQICNAVEEMKIKQYQQWRDQCACSHCSEAKEWEEEDSHVQRQHPLRPKPCTSVQVLVMLNEHRFTNLTPSFLKQAKSLSRAVPLHSPLIYSDEAPTDIRIMSVKYPQEIANQIQENHPAILTGLQPFYRVNTSMATEAIQYQDGDGGLLVVNLIPGLHEYAEKQGARMQMVSNSVLLPFRELGHDAPELGHTYTIDTHDLVAETETTKVQDFGHESLIFARRNVAISQQAIIVPHNLDHSGHRLLVEIFTKESGDSGIGIETGVRLIRAGLSFAVTGAPARYKAAEDYAKTNKLGIFSYGAIMEMEALKPWSLKQHLHDIGSETVTEYETENVFNRVSVKNNKKHLNESHLMVSKSTIPGAGMGLFVRPKPPDATRVIIPKDAIICYYSKVPLPHDSAPADNTDYLMEAERNGITRFYNPIDYDGQNIGRHINQGGLMELLQMMATQTGSTLQKREINTAAQQYCNIRYQMDGVSLMVRAAKDILLTEEPQELFGHYGIEYWIRFILEHLKEFDSNSAMVKAVLWPLLSDHSTWNRTCRQQFLMGRNITEDVRQLYKDMRCPFELPPRRRR